MNFLDLNDLKVSESMIISDDLWITYKKMKQN